MATIRDVAKMAGVSTSTVSNVINGRGFVEEGLRTRVEEAIGTLNYMPNKAARRLRRQTRPLRPLKVLGLSSMENYTEGIAVMTETVRDAAREYGFKLIEGLCEGDDIQAQNELINGLVDRDVDALICFPADCEGITPSVRLCNMRGIPFIALNRSVLGGEATAVVKSDDYLIGYSLGMYAALSGRLGRILELEYRSSDFNQVDRRRGFHDVVESSPGLDLLERLTMPWSADKNWDEAFGILKETLSRQPSVNVIYCHSDELALLAVKALGSLGRLHPADGPEHVMVLGVDGNHTALEAIRGGYMDATAEQMLARQARRAVKLALQAIGDEPIQQRISVVPTRLIHRGNIGYLNDLWAMGSSQETETRETGVQ